MKGAGHVYLRGRIWWIKYYQHGRPHQESSRSESQAVALALLRKRLRGQGSASEERVTYEDLEAGILQDYTINQYRSLDLLTNVRLKHVRAFFKGQRAVDITTPRLRQYSMMRHKQGAAAATINRELSAVRRMFKIATQDRILGQVPHFPMLEENGAREVYLTAAEFDSIFKHLPSATRGIIRFVRSTGWRITAACKLEWRDVNQADGFVLLRRENAKNAKRPQRLPLVGEVAEIIEQAAQERRLDQPAVFHHGEGRVFRRESVWRAFKKACVRAGFGRSKTLHDMRRSAARDLIRSGVSENVAMQITGHQTHEVFRRYNITAGDDVAQAMELLAAYRAQQPKGATVTVLSPSPRQMPSSAVTSAKKKVK
jgi:integrase